MAGEKLGLYLRLSRDDGMDDQESMSIGNQRAFLRGCARERGWTVSDEYVDDGYTGTNFQRPDFQRLLADIEAKRIRTVMVKDLSRLGRDQIGTLYYLQIFFPSKGVRFVAVGEGIDTAQDGAMTGVATPFLAAANDFYTADISRKVRTALDTRRKGGQFIGSSAPLGYQKDPARKGHLIPDPQTAWIVRRVFRDYLAGGSVMGTAKRLTENGVPTPSACRGMTHTQKRFPGTWSDTMVRRVLTNPTYAGHLTQNRRRKVSYKAKAYQNIPPDEWLILPNTHEPLIDQDVFDQTQERLRVRSYVPANGGEHLLTGLAFCADCGAPMTYQRDGRRVYMVCQSYREGGRLHLCASHMIREDYVLETLRRQLKMLAGKLDETALGEPEELDPARCRWERRIAALEKDLEGCRRVRGRLYTDRAAGVLTEEEFSDLFGENRARRVGLERQLEDCRRQLTCQGDQNGWREQVRQLLRFETLDRGVVTALVERVVIHQDKSLAIHFRFREPA